MPMAAHTAAPPTASPAASPKAASPLAEPMLSDVVPPAASVGVDAVEEEEPPLEEEELMLPQALVAQVREA